MLRSYNLQKADCSSRRRGFRCGSGLTRRSTSVDARIRIRVGSGPVNQLWDVEPYTRGRMGLQEGVEVLAEGCVICDPWHDGRGGNARDCARDLGPLRREELLHPAGVAAGVVVVGLVLGVVCLRVRIDLLVRPVHAPVGVLELLGDAVEAQGVDGEDLVFEPGDLVFDVVLLGDYPGDTGSE